MEKPFIPSWQRVEYAAPGFLTKLRRAVVEDNQYKVMNNIENFKY